MLNDSTLKLQQQLAAYCRDGKEIKLEGARNDRLHHYRRLVFNVSYGILEKAYPITLELLGQKHFKALVGWFMESHDSQTSQVWKMPEEFYHHVKDQSNPFVQQRPFLPDLLYMEWVEIEVHTMPDGALPISSPINHNMEQSLAFDPDHRLIHLQYPVFRGDWKNVESQKGDYFLLLFRNRESGKVYFMNISMVMAGVMTRMQEESISAMEVLNDLAKQGGFDLSTELKEGVQDFLNAMIQHKIIVGASQ